MYSVMAIFKSSMVWGLFEHTQFLITPREKKSGGERSGDLGGQMVVEMIVRKHVQKCHRHVLYEP
jgi:hypothetical protein